MNEYIAEEIMGSIADLTADLTIEDYLEVVRLTIDKLQQANNY